MLVEGQLQIRTYTGNDGVERTSVDVNADNFVNLTPRDEMGQGGSPTPIGARQDRGGQQPPQQRGPRPAPAPQVDDDEDDFDDEE